MSKVSSSKGTQLKWFSGGYFYKRDRFGGEAEAEFLVSKFLSYQGFPDFVSYEKVSEDVCRSRNFIPKGGKFVTFYRFLQQKGFSEEKINKIGSLSAESQYRFILEQLQSIGFSYEYLSYTFSRLFEIDMLTLNVDRHWNNFGILTDLRGNFSLLTLFDFGYSLGVTFASTTPTHIIVRKSKSNTISKSFKKQSSVVKPFRFNIPEDFLVFLEKRGSRESKIFRQRIRVLYGI